ncbi:hypothetical protein EVAR_51313_1 [Eumeta japonica]|uniref:Ig-like domain-containing protein n=1 Tax=Eumeta variegata TaxID=151549 RepID=A0A4C1XU95_EUMVA|nr:hypothetical protein EVAR_51313_1 [Eumeta japonica]
MVLIRRNSDIHLATRMDAGPNASLQRLRSTILPPYHAVRLWTICRRPCRMDIQNMTDFLKKLRSEVPVSVGVHFQEDFTSAEQLVDEFLGHRYCLLVWCSKHFWSFRKVVNHDKDVLVPVIGYQRCRFRVNVFFTPRCPPDTLYRNASKMMFTLNLVSTVDVDAVLGRTASLPCDVTPDIKEDRVYMVLWFRAGKTTGGKPIYRNALLSPLGLQDPWPAVTVYCVLARLFIFSLTTQQKI